MIDGDPEFKDEKVYEPLQAADLLAWFFRRRIASDRGVFAEAEEEFNVVRSILQKPTVGELIERDEMEQRIPAYMWAFLDVSV